MDEWRKPTDEELEALLLLAASREPSVSRAGVGAGAGLFVAVRGMWCYERRIAIERRERLGPRSAVVASHPSGPPVVPSLFVCDHEAVQFHVLLRTDERGLGHSRAAVDVLAQDAEALRHVRDPPMLEAPFFLGPAVLRVAPCSCRRGGRGEGGALISHTLPSELLYDRPAYRTMGPPLLLPQRLPPPVYHALSARGVLARHEGHADVRSQKLQAGRAYILPVRRGLAARHRLLDHRQSCFPSSSPAI